MSSHLEFDIYPVEGKKIWPYFASHHYLTSKYAGHRAWIAVLNDDTPIAFASIISAPSGHFKDGWRGHRTVVLPDFQGLGLGSRLSDWVGHHVVNVMTEGRGRYYSKTMHPRMGIYRNNSSLWQATSMNGKKGSPPNPNGLQFGNPDRVSFCHRYVGTSEDYEQVVNTP